MWALLSTNADGQESAAEVLSGQELVGRAARQFAQHPSLEAKLRQRVSLFGQQLVGTGSYSQLKTDSGKRFRLDLTLKAGEQLTSLQQVNDGSYLWLRRDSGGEQTTNVVDLRRVEEALRSAAVPSTPGSLVVLGGFDQLLDGLVQRFDFGRPTTATIADLPVWVVHGRWKRDEVAKLLPAQANDIAAGAVPKLEELASHLPHRVTLVLGRDNRLPLFPYRIEYSRLEPPTRFTPIMTIELFEVRAGTRLSPQYFEFQLGDQRIEDATDFFIAKLRSTTR